MTSPPKLYVIQPYDQLNSKAIASLIDSAAAKAGGIAARACSAKGTNLRAAIHGMIRDASLIIAEVSSPNPNVMYEVGIAQSLDKPLILISESGRGMPFDLSGFRVFVYDPSNAVDFVDRLSDAIRSAIQNPNAYTFSRLATEQVSKQRVFISYSHFDKEYLSRLLVHLKPLEREGIIDLWVDTRMHAGDRWKTEIESALDKATVAILLVSPDFLASDFITDNELPPLLRKAEQHGTRIIPLALKPCRFARDKHLRVFQAVNDPKSPLMLLPDGEQERYYDLVAEEVERSLNRS